MRKRFFSFVLIFSLFTALFAAEPISDYTKQKIEDFVTLRVLLKDEPYESAVKKISEIRDEALAGLPPQAVDFEQEQCILETLYFTEMYEHSLVAVGNQKELRKKMKELMKRDVKCIDSRKKGKLSDWLCLLAGDATSYYMTRSVTATFMYGFRVKKYYEKALEINPNRASARVNLGNWLFYAPQVAGGGKAKAQTQYNIAAVSASIPGEKYMAYIGVSQINYENKKFDVAKEYLQKAVDLNLGHSELDIIKKCNAKGYSNFQYLRNRSGIDEEMAEDEKDDDDR